MALTQADSLWEKALARLNDEVRQSLDVVRGPKQELLKAALSAAEKKRSTAIERRWRFKSFSGRTIVLRDIYDQIVVWIRRFVQVVDVAVQYDPGHATLPWAAVRFVLQIAADNVQKHGEVAEILITISRLVTRYAVVEKLYLDRSTQVYDQLEFAITSIYVGILNTLSDCMRCFEQGFKANFSIIFHSGFGAIPQDFHLKDSHVASLLGLIDSERQSTAADQNKEIQAQLLAYVKPVAQLVDTALRQERTATEQTFSKIAAWLSVVRCHSHYQSHYRELVPGTGQWLLESLEYERWLDYEHSILLVTGLPGYGKTSLATKVIKDRHDSVSSGLSTSKVAFFYCSNTGSEPARSQAEEVLRSIVKQLCCSDDTDSFTVFKELLSEYEDRRLLAVRDGTDEVLPLDVSKCVELIVSWTRSNSATVIVDGIDECITNRHQLIMALEEIVQKSANACRVIVTSRPDANVRSYSSRWLNLEMRSTAVQEDIQRFVDHKTNGLLLSKRLLNGNASAALTQEIKDHISTSARGMFLWAHLQLESLCGISLQPDIRAELASGTYESLDSIYRKLLADIAKSGEAAIRYIVHALSWILGSQSLLTTSSLLLAIEFDSRTEHDEKDATSLQHLSHNLIVVDEQTDTFRLLHSSLVTFLAELPEFSQPTIHAVITTRALTILDGSYDLEHPNEFMDPLVTYCTAYWVIHARQALESENETVKNDIKGFVLEDGDMSSAFADWMDRVGETIQQDSSINHMKRNLSACISASHIHTGAVFGMLPMVMWRPAGKLDLLNESGCTALYLAAEAGHSDIVEWLISQGAEVNLICGRHQSALHVACFRGQAQVVNRLLDGGADAMSHGPYGSALKTALRVGHESVALALLNRSIKIPSQEEFNELAELASYCGFRSVLGLLVSQEHGGFSSSIAVDTAGRWLTTAAFKGRVNIVRKALEGQPLRPVSRTGQDQDLYTLDAALLQCATASAALGGRDQVIQYILDRSPNLDLNLESAYGTPLRAACLMGQINTVKLLLKRGANPDHVGSLGDALQAASWQGHASIATILISVGASVNNSGGPFGSAMHAAAFGGHQSIVEMLLDHKSDTVSGSFEDAFYAAAEGRQMHILEFFMQRGYTFGREVWQLGELLHSIEGSTDTLGMGMVDDHETRHDMDWEVLD